jgi:indole-3-acetate monooxygenase
MPAPPRENGDATASRAAIDYLERVTTIAPLIAQSVERIERERRLPPPVLDALVGAGFFRMLLPRSFKGGEVDPPHFIQVIEAIAKVDASTAWCLCQTGVCAMAAAYLPSETANEIFGRDPRAILAWGSAPEARAVAVDGGYRVTGSWSFASGGHHATWLGGVCQVYDADGTQLRAADGTPLSRTMLFPADKAVWTDVWHVVGLKGTGSDSYTVSDLFVPEVYSLTRDAASDRHYHAPLYCMRTDHLYACGFAAVALGLARSMLDAFIALAQEKTPRGYKHALRNSAVTQSAIAETEARLRAARRYLMGTLDEVWHEVERANDITIDQRMAIRLAATHTIQEAKHIADMAYHAAGATAVFTSQPFERRFRDMHAVAQQVQGRRSHFETVGKFLLGVDAEIAFL